MSLILGSRIERVTVHPDGARVTRVAEFPPGASLDPTTCVVQAISPLLRPGSLRVHVDGERSVLRADTRLVAPAREGAAAPAPATRSDALLIRRLSHRRGQLAQLRHAIAKTMPIASPSAFASGDVLAPVEKGLAFNAFLESLLQHLDLKLAETEMELERRDPKARASAEAVWARGPTERSAREVRIELGPGKAERLFLSYVVPSARWWPAYTVTTQGNSARTELRIEAQVAQASLEDWEGVELALATSEVQDELQPPELPPLRLGTRAARTRRGYREPPPGLDAMFASYDRDTEGPEPETLALPAEQDWSASDVYIKAKLVDSPRSHPRPTAPEAPELPREPSRPSESTREAGARAGLSPTARWLDYPRLVLGPISDPEQRGRLVPGRDLAPEAELHALEADLDRLGPNRTVRRSSAQSGERLVVPGTVSIASNPSRTERVRIEALEVRAQLRLSTVPKSEARVHRIVELPNSTGRSLFGGRFDVLMEGSLVTSTELETVAPEKLMRFSLGAEERISVTRTVEIVDSPSTSVLGQTTHLTQRVSIRLNSRMSEPSTVEVIDRLPVNEDKNVTVDLLDSDAPAERYRPEDGDAPMRGALRWSVVVPAGGTATINFTYRVNVPTKTAAHGARGHD